MRIDVAVPVHTDTDLLLLKEEMENSEETTTRVETE